MVPVGASYKSAEDDWREKHALTAFGALDKRCAVRAFAQDFDLVLTVGAKSCHSYVGGIFALEFLLLCPNLSIVLRVLDHRCSSGHGIPFSCDISLVGEDLD